MLQSVAAINLIIGIVSTAILILLFFNEHVGKLMSTDYNSILRTDTTPFFNPASSYNNHSNLLFDHCELQELDPWDPMIVNYLNPNMIPWKNCIPTYKVLSKLVDGQLFIYDNTIDGTCFYRCLHPKDDHALIYSNWIPIVNGTRPRCDVIEVNCSKVNADGTPGKNVYYRYLHAQVFRPDEAEGIQDNLKKPDVHIILFDSVSESQFVRSMPKTRHVLREYYESISFRHLNKIGLNSRPNGFALLMGKAIYPVKKSLISRGHNIDYQNKSYCNKYLNNDQFIGFRFQDDGYVTMMNEDWSLGVFNWPDCKGFQEKPTDHYMRPFQLRVEGDDWKSDYLSEAIHRNSCHEAFFHQMEYLKNFIDKYPDKPKFSLTWMSYLAHDDINALYHADDYFYRFFRNYREKLSNSYLLIMGDHGNRFSSIRHTSVGEMEDNNPFLFFSAPESVREDGELMTQIRKNSKELITHYDLYATLLDIAKPENPRIPNPLIRGSSILRELSQPRTCDRLRIPFEYCSCHVEKIPLPKHSSVGIKAASIMIKEMNRVLEEDPDTRGKCAELTLNEESLNVEWLAERSKTRIYKVKYNTKPGNGEFLGNVVQNPDEKDQFQILSERFPRMNRYGNQTRCANTAKYAAYCYCKDLLKESTGTLNSIAALPENTVIPVNNFDSTVEIGKTSKSPISPTRL
ncbi:hypothetical protein FO519_009205 [Halicephalobus sp. NKZ332]|nr:hypothetical protein FO519_009205 [Halicephalobus sp. NKZ332]